MSDCAVGCVIRDRHLAGCEHEEVCRGCVPRPAEFGLLCPWCFQRLTGDVVDAPGLVEHLRVLAEPHAGTRPAGDGRGSSDPAEGSILSGAVSAADELHAVLAEYARLVTSEHPSGERMAGPDQRGVWRTQDTWHVDDYGTYLRPSVVAGITDPKATVRLVRWLLPWLRWCSEQSWAGTMRTEVATLVRTTLARWPVEDVRTRHIPATLCPRCDRASLTYTPPAEVLAPFVVACANPECGRVFSEDEWTRLVQLLGIAERRAG